MLNWSEWNWSDTRLDRIPGSLVCDWSVKLEGQGQRERDLSECERVFGWLSVTQKIKLNLSIV